MAADRTEQIDLLGVNQARSQELIALYDQWGPGALVLPWQQIISRDDMAYQRQRLYNTSVTQKA